MKTLVSGLVLLLFILLATSSTLLGQSRISSEEFKFKNEIFRIELFSVDQAPFAYEVKLFQTARIDSFKLVALKPEVFNKRFEDGMTGYFSSKNPVVNLSTAEISELSDISNRILLGIVVEEASMSTDPIAGLIEIVDKIQIYQQDYSKGEMVKEHMFRVDSVEMEIFEGNIKNILVFGHKFDPASKKYNTPLIFFNWTPIPFSGLYDYGFRFGTLYNQKEAPDYECCLKCLLTYYPKLNLNSDDYSPQNKIYSFKPGDKRKNRILYKENTKKILQARVYSDFAGIRGDNPNGLIQIEVTKKLILNHKKFQTIQMGSASMFSHFEPKFTWSKIEENNKAMDLIDGDSATYATTIDMLNHQNFSFSANLNVVAFYYPYYKSSSAFDIGITLNRVAIGDSTITGTAAKRIATYTPYNITTFSVFGELNHFISTDPRYGVKITFRPIWYRALTNRFEQISRVEDFPGREFLEDQYLVLGTEFFGFIKLSDQSEFFGRLRTHHLGKDFKTNIFQLQLGYSFSVFK